MGALYLGNKLIYPMKDNGITYSFPFLPDGYIKCEYIENTSNAYINTGFKPNQDTKVEMDVNIISNNKDNGLFGADSKWRQMGYAVLISEAAAWHFNQNQYTSLPNLGINIFQRLNFIKDKNKFYIDNKLIHTANYVSFTTTSSLYLLAINRNNAPVSIWYGNMQSQIYSCKIWDNNILKRDYIPCFEISSKLYGLYDKVEKKFYLSPNGTKFIGG